MARSALEEFIQNWSLADLLNGLLDPASVVGWPGRLTSKLDGRKKQSVEDIAYGSGLSRESVEKWRLGHTDAPRTRNLRQALANCEHLLFARGSGDAELLNWAESVSSRLLHVADQRRSAKNQKLSELRSLLSKDAPVLGIAQFDALPVEPRLRIDCLVVGHGPAQRRIAGDRLCYLPESATLLGSDAKMRPTVSWAPESVEACNDLHSRTHLFVPRDFVVEGVKRLKDEAVRLYVCTDQSYYGPVDAAKRCGFQVTGCLGLGGIAALITPEGEQRPRNHSEPAIGLGCAGIIVLVGYAMGKPHYRSRYVLVIRKGIRDTGDIYLRRDGRPIATDPRNISQSRFLFISPEVEGSSFDVFAADYNGARCVSLLAGEPSSWESFVHEGQELGDWVGYRQARFWSCAPGRGVPEPVVRLDPHEPLHGTLSAEDAQQTNRPDQSLSHGG